jgi:hypothetical protein
MTTPLHTRAIITRWHRLGFSAEQYDIGIPYTADRAAAEKLPEVVAAVEKMQKRCHHGETVTIDFRDA